MKKWKHILSLILVTAIFLSIGCITSFAVDTNGFTEGTIVPVTPGNWNPAPSNPAPSNPGFNPAPNNPDQDYDDDEDEESYIIYAKAHKGGYITPRGNVEVSEGDDQAFEITPKSKYKIEKVLVDGKDKGALDFYVFEDVTCDHTIEAYFISIAESETAKTDTEFNPNTGAF